MTQPQNLQNAPADADPASDSSATDCVDHASKSSEVLSPYSGKSKSEPPSVTPAKHPLLHDKPESPRPKPATWESRDPEEPWCPKELEEFLDFEIHYENDLQAHTPTIGSWAVTAATKRGRMHAHHGTHREDAYAWKFTPSFAIYCVCDGAGSAQLSRIGSAFAVRSICDLVAGELLAKQKEIQTCSAASLHTNLKSVLHHAIAMTANRICEMADKSKRNANDFRCTVLTALHYRHPSGGFFVFGNVGDGFIALKRREKEAERIGVSDSGNFSGEVLCFMPDGQVGEYYKNSLDKLPMFSDEEVETVMLCTDGIEDPFFPVHKNIAAMYHQLEHGFDSELCGVNYPDSARPSSVLNAKEPAKELLKWLHFEKRGENDDRTILLVHKRSEAATTSIATADDKVEILVKKNDKTVCHEGNSLHSVSAKLRDWHAMPFIIFMSGTMLGIVMGLLLGIFVFRGASENLSQGLISSDGSRQRSISIPVNSHRNAPPIQ